MKPLLVLFALSLIFVSTPILADDSAGPIPQKALDAMEFFVGNWTGTSQDGEAARTQWDARSWVRGKYALTVKSYEMKGDKLTASAAVIGWRSDTNEMTEYWFTSEGARIAIRYPLDKMTDDVWEGTFDGVLEKGEEAEGTCVLTKTDAGFDFVAEWESEGEKRTMSNSVIRVETLDFPNPDRNMDIASPPNMRRQMAKLIGMWDLSASILGEEDENGTYRAQWGPARFCALLSMNTPERKQVGIGGWDPLTNEYVEYWFTSKGECGNPRYVVNRGNTWTGVNTRFMPDGARMDDMLELVIGDGELTVIAGDAEGRRSAKLECRRR